MLKQRKEKYLRSFESTLYGKLCVKYKKEFLEQTKIYCRMIKLGRKSMIYK